MLYRKLKENLHAVNINGEITIFDKKSNVFYFFDETQTQQILNFLDGKDLLEKKIDESLFEKSESKYIIPYFKNIEGIDNYSWANVNHFRTHEDIDIKFLDKVELLMLYFFLFIGKDYFINQKLNLIKKIKKSKKLKHDLTYCKAIGNYIHKISNKLPFNMKCLEYSLILSTYLLLKQYDCTFKIGIQKYDFLSHAWVEVDSQPIADMPDLSYRLAVIFEI